MFLKNIKMFRIIQTHPPNIRRNHHLFIGSATTSVQHLRWCFKPLPQGISDVDVFMCSSTVHSCSSSFLLVDSRNNSRKAGTTLTAWNKTITLITVVASRLILETLQRAPLVAVYCIPPVCQKSKVWTCIKLLNQALPKHPHFNIF
jgi:hypothetical protein